MSGERVERTFWDTDFFEDSRIEDVMVEFGDAGAAWYMRLALRVLREGGAIRKKGAIGILRRMEIGDRAEAFIDYCVSIGLFFESGECISSKRAEREIADLTTKREKWREKKRGQRKVVPGDKPGTQEQEQEEEQEDPKKETVTPITVAVPAVEYPPELDTPGVREWVPKFAAKLRANGRTLDAIQLDAHFARYLGYPKPADDFETALKHSCSLTVCKNLYDPPTAGNGARASPRETAEERKRRELDEYIERMDREDRERGTA